MPKKESSAEEDIHRIIWSYTSHQKENKFVWGPHKVPVEMEFEEVMLSANKSESGLTYCREGAAGREEILLLADKGKIRLSPVEPFHTPVALSTHLLIDFSRSVIVEPRSTIIVMATFPLELAVAYYNRKAAGERIIDIFSLNRAKFTLYGSIKNGLLCKYWQSDIYQNIPALNPLKEGLLKLTIQNQGAKWAEVHKAVFSAQGMKIYYNPNLVAQKAIMKINSESNAETNFIDEPLQPGMTKALEQFSTRLLSLPGRTVMEEGY